jgi:hypothetical protein
MTIYSHTVYGNKPTYWLVEKISKFGVIKKKCQLVKSTHIRYLENGKQTTQLRLYKLRSLAI